MLKRFFKGLGVAFACSYALASPQNTIFLNDNVNRKNALIGDSSNYNDLYSLFTDDGFNNLIAFDLLICNDATMTINIIDAEHEESIYNISYNFNQDINNNGSYKFYIGCYYEDLNSNNDATNGCFLYSISYNTNIGYDSQQNNFYFINSSQNNFLYNDNRICSIAQAKGDQLYLKLEVENIYILNSDEYGISDDLKLDYDNFIQYIVSEDRKIKYFNFLDTIDSAVSQGVQDALTYAFRNGESQGYDNGYRDGLQDNDAAFNQGYELGIGDNIIPKNIIGWFRIVARGVQSVLDIEILPYMKVGYIISIPIMFGLILFIVRLVRGD